MRNYRKITGLLLGSIASVTMGVAPAQAAHISIDMLDIEIRADVCVTINGQTYCEATPVKLQVK